MEKEKKVTMEDVAREVGVSLMTVSRVIKGYPNVSEKTQQEVLRIVEKLKYIPIKKSKSRITGKTRLIGLLIPDIKSQFYAELASGIEDKAFELDYNIIFRSTNNDPKKTEISIQQLKNLNVDGFLIASASMDEPAVYNLIREKAPFVLVNRNLKEEIANYVIIDNYKGADLITRHLIELGYSKIAHIAIDQKFSTGLGRLQGYKKALKEFGIKTLDEYIVQIQNHITSEDAYRATKHLLSLPNPPEAIFGGSDLIALGVFNALKEKELKVPEDIAVVGFDDTDFASNKWINLTTVGQRKYEMGNLALEILTNYIERAEKDYLHRVVLEPKLIVRGSCGFHLKKK
jgi:LacI family transcriptional regulator